jgi:hypothetical protein
MEQDLLTTQNQPTQPSKKMNTKLYPTPPDSLSTTQYWFAQIITQPLQEDSLLPPLTPSGQSIQVEASKHIKPSQLHPHERIQIYYQQYWYRLLNILHESFPLVVRLFGYTDFNQTIAIPYLKKYPPNHWSLNQLGDRLPQWIKEEYHQPDQALVYNAAVLDEAFTSSFVASHYPPIDPKNTIQQGGTDSLLSLKIYLQPHVHIFQWEYNLFIFRQAFLKESVEYWIENDFPKLEKEKNYSFIFHRGPENNLFWRSISPGQFFLIQLLKKGSTIEEACEALESEDEAIVTDASTHLQQWFHEWTQLGLLTVFN